MGQVHGVYFKRKVLALVSILFSGNPIFTGLPVERVAQYLPNTLKRACEEAGVVKLTPHQLRGGGASTALEEGASWEEIQLRGRSQSREGMASYFKISIEAQRGLMPM